MAPSTTEIAISVTSSSTQNLQKITGLLLSDQNPAAPYQEPIAFTFQKTADANKFMLKTDIRAGTYKFLVFSTDFKKPVISRDASLIGNGNFLSNQAKAALVEVFKMFDEKMQAGTGIGVHGYQSQLAVSQQSFEKLVRLTLVMSL